MAITINFVTIRQDADLAPMLKGLPDDRCQCPHWGYVFKGKMTVRYADHDEVIGPGEAFYLPPGHTPAADTGTEFVQFSPTDELAVSEAAMAKNMQEMRTAKRPARHLGKERVRRYGLTWRTPSGMCCAADDAVIQPNAHRRLSA